MGAEGGGWGEWAGDDVRRAFATQVVLDASRLMSYDNKDELYSVLFIWIFRIFVFLVSK